MPPGHFNAIFINNSDELDKPEYIDALREAKNQNGFIFWNHPNWVSQQPDTTLWWTEHTQLYEQGLMQGIEVVNGRYCPESHRWCLEKKLTMIGSSDVHAPMQIFSNGNHRTMTLVFARSKTPEAIHDALKERRTAVYHEEYIIGEEVYLKELFEKAVDIQITIAANNTATITFTNNSDLIFHIRKAGHDPRLTYLRNTSLEAFTIKPQSANSITVRLNDGITGGDVNIIIENFLTQPNKGMRYTIKI